MLSSMQTKIHNLNIGAEKLHEKLINKIEHYSTSVQSFYSFIGNCITGFLFTLLLSFFLKLNSKQIL